MSCIKYNNKVENLVYVYDLNLKKITLPMSLWVKPETFNDWIDLEFVNANIYVQFKVFRNLHFEMFSKQTAASFTNILRAAFAPICVRQKSTSLKCKYRCQFHQHFMSSFFVQKSFKQLFCTNGLGFNFLAKVNWRKSCSLNVGEIGCR